MVFMVGKSIRDGETPGNASTPDNRAVCAMETHKLSIALHML